jgi:capsular exopolysaccharide synthesis family protein
MSRIDKALQTWEKKALTSETSARFELDKYGQEDGAGGRPTSSDVTAVLAPPPSPEPSPAAQKPPAQTRTRGNKISPRRAEVDLEARLVTGGSGAVSLEQYRRLAAVLHDIQLQQGLKTLMLTSALPAEGKTLTTINLALTLSESYARRVLVVDADLRWPSVHKILGLRNDAGLSEALHNADLEPHIEEVSPRLAVLSAGSTGLTPLAGLTSPRMAQLVETFASRFDWVIIDTPPVGLLPDAQLLARLTRAVVFVIAAGATSSAAVERAIAELGPDCVIGTVLNRVDARRIPEAGYYARYGYGYADTTET